MIELNAKSSLIQYSSSRNVILTLRPIDGKTVKLKDSSNTKHSYNLYWELLSLSFNLLNRSGIEETHHPLFNIIFIILRQQFHSLFPFK